MGSENVLNHDIAGSVYSALKGLETGNLSFRREQRLLKHLMKIDSNLAKDAVAEEGKLMGAAKPIVAAEMSAAKSAKGLLEKEEGQAMKIGSEVLKADEGLAAGIAKEDGKLLSGKLDAEGLAKDEEGFAKKLEGAEK